MMRTAIAPPGMTISLDHASLSLPHHGRTHDWVAVVNDCGAVVGGWRGIVCDGSVIPSGSVESPAPGTARGAGIRERRQGHSYDIDKERAGTRLFWQCALDYADFVGEIVADKTRVPENDHGAGDGIAPEDRECCIRRVGKKAVRALAPHRDELAGGHVPSNAVGPVGKADGEGVYAPQGDPAILMREALCSLHKEEIHFLYSLRRGMGGA
jgi:hypothetical protein